MTTCNVCNTSSHNRVSLKNPKTKRFGWDETFMNLAMLVSKRSACKFHET